MPTRLEKLFLCVYFEYNCINNDCNKCVFKDGYYK